jgi:hypothetical protein
LKNKAPVQSLITPEQNRNTNKAKNILKQNTPPNNIPQHSNNKNKNKNKNN